MTTPNDKEIAWQGRIQEKVGQATKAVVDRLVSMPKSGFGQLSPTERRDAHETIAKEIADVMYRLGTFVVAGAQDFQVCSLEQVTIKGADKLKLALVPIASEGGPINLEQLAANSGKQVVVAFINGVAYSQAREALSKAIHREQTDWVSRQEDEPDAPAAGSDEPQPGGGYPAGMLVGTANARVTTKAHTDGELIADQPGETTDDQQDQDQSTARTELSGASISDRSDASHTNQSSDELAGRVAEQPAEGPDSSGDQPTRPRRGGRARGIQPHH